MIGRLLFFNFSFPVSHKWYCRKLFI